MALLLPPDAKKIFEGLMYTVWQYEQKLFDGSYATYEKISRGDYAAVIAILPDKRILLIEDEQPDRKSVLTPAGGKVDPGEEPIAAAQRELLEETGYTAEAFTPWYTYSPQGRVLWEGHFFIARNIRKIQEPALEPGEKIKVLTFSFDEFLALGHNPQLRDLMLRIHLLQALLDSQKRAELEKLFYGA